MCAAHLGAQQTGRIALAPGIELLAGRVVGQATVAHKGAHVGIAPLVNASLQDTLYVGRVCLRRKRAKGSFYTFTRKMNVSCFTNWIDGPSRNSLSRFQLSTIINVLNSTIITEIVCLDGIIIVLLHQKVGNIAKIS